MTFFMIIIVIRHIFSSSKKKVTLWPDLGPVPVRGQGPEGIHGTHESVVVFVIGLMGIWSTSAETERKVRPDG